ncbi:hypothetical protein Tco_1562331 [Tanacetum coccineum]
MELSPRSGPQSSICPTVGMTPPRVHPITRAPEQTHPGNTPRVVDIQELNQDIPKEQVGSVHMIHSLHSGSKSSSKVMGNWSHVPP